MAFDSLIRGGQVVQASGSAGWISQSMRGGLSPWRRRSPARLGR